MSTEASATSAEQLSEAVSETPYIGRFAPSPTGPLHAGSLVAALASWLDARAHGGRWLVRIEDVDGPRCSAAAAEVILQQLACCGLLPDEPPVWQSSRGGAYAAVLAGLIGARQAYPCACSRSDIEQVLAERGCLPGRHRLAVYPGTCRDGLHGKPARAWRLRIADTPDQARSMDWQDRRLGAQSQDLAAEVGDVVLRRADGLWAYQLAVVVDDGWQGISHIVRGEDLADNTARQIHLQQLLGLATPAYLHTPLVRAADGQKLSKQTGAEALTLADPLAELRGAAAVLGLPPLAARNLADWLATACQAWAQTWSMSGAVETGPAAAAAAAAAAAVN